MPEAIPSVDVAAFRRARVRTLAVRATLALAALGLLGLAAWAGSGLDVPPENALPQGRSGVVVVDLSRSIGDAPERALVRALKRLDSPDSRLGLVMFSDIAYELFPPGTPGTELRPIERFFQPIPHRKTSSGDPVYPVTPWDDSFRGGTQISTGIQAGWDALKRDGIRNGAILLISDLATEPDDIQHVADLAIAMRRANVDTRILGLDPKPNDKALFAQMFGADSFVTAATPVGVGGLAHRIRARLTAPLPWALVGAALALLGALAVNELACGRLALPAGRSA